MSHDTAASAEQYDHSHPKGIERSYWHLARNAILWRKLSPYLQEGTTVLDLGCGPGVVVSYLRSKGVDCHGADIGTPEPVNEATAGSLFLGQDACELPQSFRQQVSVILLLDVIEHIVDPAAFLQRCMESFGNARTILVTLPARMEIWSNYDEFYGHQTRYTSESLDELVGKTGLRKVESGYFFHGLYLAARCLKFIKPTRAVRVLAPKSEWPQRVIATAFDLEQRLVPSQVWGSSLYAVLQR